MPYHRIDLPWHNRDRIGGTQCLTVELETENLGAVFIVTVQMSERNKERIAGARPCHHSTVNSSLRILSERKIRLTGNWLQIRQRSKPQSSRLCQERDDRLRRMAID